MNFAESPSDSPLLETPAAERRRKCRITHPFAATICGFDAGGDSFKCMTIIDNLSASGLYLCLRQNLEAGSIISVVIHIAGLSSGEEPEPHVFFRGEVWRIDHLPSGDYGYGFTSKCHQLRYLKFVNAVVVNSLSSNWS